MLPKQFSRKLVSSVEKGVRNVKGDGMEEDLSRRREEGAYMGWVASLAWHAPPGRGGHATSTGSTCLTYQTLLGLTTSTGPPMARICSFAKHKGALYPVRPRRWWYSEASHGCMSLRCNLPDAPQCQSAAKGRVRTRRWFSIGFVVSCCSPFGNLVSLPCER